MRLRHFRRPSLRHTVGASAAADTLGHALHAASALLLCQLGVQRPHHAGVGGAELFRNSGAPGPQDGYLVQRSFAPFDSFSAPLVREDTAPSTSVPFGVSVAIALGLSVLRGCTKSPRRGLFFARIFFGDSVP